MAQQRAREDGRRAESARQAIRAVAAAFKTLRLYPLGHTLTAAALGSAQRLLAAHAAAYGSLTVAVPARGLTLDAATQIPDDDVVGDLGRALRARSVPELRFLPGVQGGELGELLTALHLPVQHLEREGGLGKLLRERGVQNLLVEGAPSAAAAPREQTEALVQALRSGTVESVIAALQLPNGTPQLVAGLLRDLDRRIVRWPTPAQSAAWTVLGQALATLREGWQRAVCAMIAEMTDEPWAASIAAQWPPALVAGLAAEPGEGRSQRIADAVRVLHRAAPRGPLPPAPEPDPARIAEASASLLEWTPARLRVQALRRLLDLLPALDSARLVDAVDLVEREVVQRVAEDDSAALVTVVTGLTAALRGMTDARADLLQAALHHIMSLGARELFERTLALPLTGEHPFVQAMQAAPAETVRVLLELAGEEERRAVRRGVVDLLSVLAAGRPDVLAEHVVDPRWSIARNAVAVLGHIASPEILPYLRAGLDHDDVRVRRETMHALADVGGPDAVALLAEGLRASDEATREGAAHWLGMTERPEAVEALAVVLAEGGLGDDAAVKREAVRSLARLGGPRAAEILARLAAAELPLVRRRAAEEVRQEAADGLTRMRRGEG